MSERTAIFWPGLLTVGANIAVAAPDLRRVREQLLGLEHHVVIDPFLSETAKLADVVLPGATFAEESGTVTTIEGRVIRVDQAVAPVPSHSEFDIIADLAERLDSPVSFRYRSAEAIFEEMKRLSAAAPIDYSGMTYDRIRDEGGLFWPCPSEQHPGTPLLYQERFAHPDGRARFTAVAANGFPDKTDRSFPLVMTTGRLLTEFLSGTQTSRTKLDDEVDAGPYVEIHPTTAAAYQIERGHHVLISSQLGSVALRWRPNKRIRYDTLFMPYHWPTCNRLVPSELDPTAKIPTLKRTAVSIEPIHGRTSSVLITTLR